MDNEFKLPDYYNITKPKSEEKLIKRKCFRCGKEKEIGKFERYCSPECRTIATQHDMGSTWIVW